MPTAQGRVFGSVMCMRLDSGRGPFERRGRIARGNSCVVVYCYDISAVDQVFKYIDDGTAGDACRVASDGTDSRLKPRATQFDLSHPISRQAHHWPATLTGEGVGYYRNLSPGCGMIPRN